jgi:CRP/FNR family transcriptional regulator, anaerobic regulatory protein
VKSQSSLDPGPSLRAIPFAGSPGTGAVTRRLLSPRQQKELASLATRMTVERRQVVYRAGTPSSSIYICSSGALKTFRDLPSGKRRILAFIFADDAFGLAVNGRYCNTVQALSKSTYYQIPIEALMPVLRQDAELEWQFLTKVAHELREAQRRALMVSRRSATGRFAGFLKSLETQIPLTPEKDTIPLPMSRSDIADYLGLSLEAISRATGRLVRDGTIAFEGPHVVRVVDRAALERLAHDA